jgi:hypothetical protein
MGIPFFVIGVVCLFLHGDNCKLIGAIFIGGSIMQIAVGVAVVKYVAPLMLSIFENLQKDGWRR